MLWKDEDYLKTIAIIPARSGSKGLKDKNIKKLAGKPLMAYSIDAAIKSKIFDTIMVSTDSDEYAKIAMELGAEVPFLRSEKTASDEATTRDCMLEVLDKYRSLGKTFNRFMILQPTSPLRTWQDILEADKLYRLKNAKSVVSICEMDHSPLWSNKIGEDLSLSNFIRRSNGVRRQELNKFYRINGAIYLHDVKHYLNNEYYFDDKCFGYIMKKETSIDIDDSLDFKIAEVILGEML